LITTTFDFVGSDPVAVQVVGNVDGVVSTTAGDVELVVKPLGKVATM
jgi:hypothetical protein